MGGVGEIDTEAVGRGESRALADEHRHKAGMEQLRYLVAQRHAALLGEDDGGDRETKPAHVGHCFAQERNSLAMDGFSRQTVADYKDNVGSGEAHLLQPHAALFAQAPAEVGAREKSMSIKSITMHVNHLQAEVFQLIAHERFVQRQVDGVASLGVGETEAEQFGGGHAGSRVAEGDAGVGETPQFLPAVALVLRNMSSNLIHSLSRWQAVDDQCARACVPRGR